MHHAMNVLTATARSMREPLRYVIVFTLHPGFRILCQSSIRHRTAWSRTIFRAWCRLVTGGVVSTIQEVGSDQTSGTFNSPTRTAFSGIGFGPKCAFSSTRRSPVVRAPRRVPTAAPPSGWTVLTPGPRTCSDSFGPPRRRLLPGRPSLRRWYGESWIHGRDPANWVDRREPVTGASWQWRREPRGDKPDHSGARQAANRTLPGARICCRDAIVRRDRAGRKPTRSLVSFQFLHVVNIRHEDELRIGLDAEFRGVLAEVFDLLRHPSTDRLVDRPPDGE